MVPLFGYTGTGVMLARIDENRDLWVKSRETGYFTDLRTGDILDTWYNPFTEKTVPVYHFCNDLLLSWDYTHDYTNPVTPDGGPRSSTDPRITPSEHFTFSCPRLELEDRSLPTVRFNASFSRISECWPFMQMGGTPFAGVVLFGRMFSHKGLPNLAEVPPKVRAYIERNAPEFLELPDSWIPDNSRVDTWKAHARDIRPENPSHPWQPSAFKVPTGSGADHRS